MNYSSALGSSIHQTIGLLMSTKPCDVIVGQPTTKTMNWMTEQMAQMVVPVKTTVWGGLHGSLALVLDDEEYALITKNVITVKSAVGRAVVAIHLALGKYVTSKCAPAAVTDPIALLHGELKAQCKQFDLITKQNAKLLTATAKNSSSGGGCGGGGQKCSPTALCPNNNKMVTLKPEDYYSLETTKSKIPTWYKPRKTK